MTDGDAVIEVDGKGKAVGSVDMAGGLATELYDPASFDVGDPCTMAYHQYRTCREPFVDGAAAARRIRVPHKSYYEELGCGERQRKVMGAAEKGKFNIAALMGGVDTLSFLQSTQEEIVREAEECIRAAGSRGAYILGSGCVVPRAAKIENILALARLAGSRRY